MPLMVRNDCSFTVVGHFDTLRRGTATERGGTVPVETAFEVVRFVEEVHLYGHHAHHRVQIQHLQQGPRPT